MLDNILSISSMTWIKMLLQTRFFFFGMKNLCYVSFIKLLYILIHVLKNSPPKTEFHPVFSSTVFINKRHSVLWEVFCESWVRSLARNLCTIRRDTDTTVHEREWKHYPERGFIQLIIPQTNMYRVKSFVNHRMEQIFYVICAWQKHLR